ncbi:MAG: hypothetical protein WA826_19235 [Silvibacterium sp.]
MSEKPVQAFFAEAANFATAEVSVQATQKESSMRLAAAMRRVRARVSRGEGARSCEKPERKLLTAGGTVGRFTVYVLL